MVQDQIDDAFFNSNIFSYWFHFSDRDAVRLRSGKAAAGGQCRRACRYDYEVFNAGVSCDTSLGGLERADWVLDQENAKILILELGANDLLRGLPPEKMKENLDKIIRKAKARNIEVLLCGMLAPPAAGAEYQREFTMVFPDLADEHGVELLPFVLDGVALHKELNQADGRHPNAEGEKIMTENVYKVLKPMLARQATHDG